MSSNYQSTFGGGGQSDTERNYREGNWGQGGLDAEALASKFGLDRSQEGTSENDIWGTRPDGSKVYIGKSSEGLKHNKELIQAHSKQANSKEVSHAGVPESLSSSGDVRGAVLNMWKGEKEPAPAPVEAPKKPAVDSPHLAEAKERVHTWEQHSWSGDRAKETFEQGKEKKEYDFTAKETSAPGMEKKEYDFTNDNFTNQANQSKQATGLLDQYKLKLS